METIGAKVKRSAVVLAIAAMIPASGFAFGDSWGGGRAKGPPQEAIDACAGKSEGDAVRFTNPRGETVSGTCREIRGRLVAVPEGGPWGRGGMDPERRLARMARALDLTEPQREQVKAILASEREKTEPLRRNLAEIREKIRKAALAEPFDEAAVRALAAGQNDTRVELVVSRARVKSQVFSLLTPEQRERAKELRPWGKGRHGHRPCM